MPPKSRAYNIAIIPSKEISKKAIKISRALKSKDVFFTLDGKKYFPHVTLYMAEFPIKNLPQVKNELDGIAQKLKSFKAKSTRYRHEDGWVHVSFKKTAPLLKLQKEIIYRTNKLRSGLLMRNDKARFPSLPKPLKRNLKLYGFSNAFYQFTVPHITFTRLKKSNPKSLTALKKYDFSFPVRKFGLFEREEHGTCRKLTKEFKLK